MRTRNPSTSEEAYAAALRSLHVKFLAVLPRLQTHFRIRFRYVRCPGRFDDAVAEAVAVAWKWFLTLEEKGKDINEFVSTLADYAVRHVSSGRGVCGQEKAKDAMSRRAQRHKGFRMERLIPTRQRPHEILYGEPRGQERVDSFEDRLRDNTRSPIPEQAAFRIDYPLWLAQLGERNKSIAEDMATDLATGELAARHGVSPARISQLRRQLHADWRRFHGEAAVC